TADRNRSHWRTSKTPSYTKSVSWQHHQKHKSQERRDYMRHDRLRAVAQFRGQQVNSDLGEGFVIHKMIL
ncbi:hypothetical protein ODW73_19555, partial [Escherichia coli]|nr:hypothetical protein [Escherichia coli]